MKKKLKVGIIGCGRIGSLLEDDPLRDKPATHAGGFAAHPATTIATACDLNRQRLEKFRQKWNIPMDKLYTDYREMLKREKPEIVSIAAWTEYHCEMVLAAAASPATKGIYCEKPISLDIKEANRMIRTCEKRNIPLVIGHERRFDANFQNVKQMVEKETFGPLKAVFAHALSWAPPKLPRHKYVGGSLYHDGTHLMDLILYYGGPASWVMGFAKRPNGRNFVESIAGGIIQLRNGVNVFVEGGGEREYFKFDIDLQFQRGRIVIGNGGIHVFRATKSRHYTGFWELEPVPYIPPKKTENSFVSGVNTLVNAIRKGTPPLSTGRDGRDALELILALYRSAEKGGKKIRLTGKTI